MRESREKLSKLDRTVVIAGNPQDPGAAPDDLGQFLGSIQPKRRITPNRSRSGAVSCPARVVAPTSVKQGKVNRD